MWNGNIPTAAASINVVMMSKFVAADGGETERSILILNRIILANH
ncbi:MAG: hypothetical protein WBF90_37650 [Rivularia sp. (in: cyanobacteria)]